MSGGSESSSFGSYSESYSTSGDESSASTVVDDAEKGTGGVEVPAIVTKAKAVSDESSQSSLPKAHSVPASSGVEHVSVDERAQPSNTPASPPLTKEEEKQQVILDLKKRKMIIVGCIGNFRAKLKSAQEDEIAGWQAQLTTAKTELASIDLRLRELEPTRPQSTPLTIHSRSASSTTSESLIRNSNSSDTVRRSADKGARTLVRSSSGRIVAPSVTMSAHKDGGCALVLRGDFAERALELQQSFDSVTHRKLLRDVCTTLHDDDVFVRVACKQDTDSDDVLQMSKGVIVNRLATTGSIVEKILLPKFKLSADDVGATVLYEKLADGGMVALTPSLPLWYYPMIRKDTHLVLIWSQKKERAEAVVAEQSNANPLVPALAADECFADELLAPLEVWLQWGDDIDTDDIVDEVDEETKESTTANAAGVDAADAGSSSSELDLAATTETAAVPVEATKTTKRNLSRSDSFEYDYGTTSSSSEDIEVAPTPSKTSTVETTTPTKAPVVIAAASAPSSSTANQKEPLKVSQIATVEVVESSSSSSEDLALEIRIEPTVESAPLDSNEKKKNAKKNITKSTTKTKEKSSESPKKDEAAKKKKEKKKAAESAAAKAAKAKEERRRQRETVEYQYDFGDMSSSSDEPLSLPPPVPATSAEVFECASKGDVDALRRVHAAATLDLAKMSDSKDWTPLHHAAYRGRTKTCAYLCDEVRVPIDALTKSAHSALHLAAQEGRYNTTRVLCARGANGWLRDKNGHTPMDLAYFRNHMAVADILYDYCDDR